MKMKQPDYLRMIPFVLGALVYSSTAIAKNYECMLVQAKPLKRYITAEDAQRGGVPGGKVVIEGVNFGSYPKVYFGTGRRLAQVVNQGRNVGLDSITIQLPPGTGTGTYKLIVQNTSGPFLDNNGHINPIFCFGSVTIKIVKGHPGP